METKLRCLDLFCGAGGSAMGLHRAGFEVVGVDIKPQPRYPFEFHQADAMEYPLEGFDLIWASPPCQAYSITRNIRHNSEDKHPKLIDAVRERLQRSGATWIIENVVGAPLINPVTLCGTLFGLKVYRHRIFESSHLLLASQCHSHRIPCTKQGCKPEPGKFIVVAGHFADVKASGEAMGINWMKRSELAQAIPPAYSEFLGKQILTMLKV